MKNYEYFLDLVIFSKIFSMFGKNLLIVIISVWSYFIYDRFLAKFRKLLQRMICLTSLRFPTRRAVSNTHTPLQQLINNFRYSSASFLRLLHPNSPTNVMPILCALSRGSVIVAYVVPRSGARPESSDCAGLIARSTENREKEKIIKYFSWLLKYIFFLLFCIPPM